MSFRSRIVHAESRSSRAGHASAYALPLIAATAGVALVAWGAAVRAGPSQPSSIPVLDAQLQGIPLQGGTASTADVDVKTVLNQYCVVCHNQQMLTAGLALDVVDAANPAEHPEIFEKVIKKLRTSTMPPSGMPRPDPKTYAEVAGWLEQKLDEAWAENLDPGRMPPIHRLNRMEYNNALRDLLALDVDVRSQLPGDETTDGGFDNVASALTISTAHLERYMSVARTATRLAIGLPPAAPAVNIFRVDDLLNQESRMSEDLPIGSRGGVAVRHQFPADGEYEIKVRLQVNYADYFRGMGWPQELEIRLDGELLGRFTVGGGGTAFSPGPEHFAGTYEGRGDADWEKYMQFGGEEGLNVRVPVGAGPHVVGVSFVRDQWESEYLLPQPPLRRYGLAEKNSHDYMGFAGVREVHVGGPYQVQGLPKDTPSRRAIFTCQPSSEAEEEGCAVEIVSRMAHRAYRRPVTERQVHTLMEFFREGRKNGKSFDAGIQFALERMLVDPAFLLRVYGDPSAEGRRASASGDVYPLSDLEVASRLSFFLWGSIPDEELLELAEQGKLTDRKVLRAQTQRMLADPRAARSLVDGFVSQWLMLRVVDEKTLDERLYADFDYNLRDALRQETELFVESTIREDRSVLDLLRADYSYLNERLARHYGIRGVAGSHFRRVKLPNLEQRGGILGQGSVLLVSSYPDRTTPVLRGKWLLENILGNEVPLPPANVNTALQEEATAGSRPLTIRERLAQHRSSPVCSTCHSVMDPLGFALESFDAVGGWRTVDERGNPVDNAGAWANGTQINGFAGLRALLLSQGDQFVGTVTQKLMGYGLGRTLNYNDRPTIRKIVRDAAAKDYSWSAVVQGIVESPQFLMQSRAPVTEQSSR